MTYLWPQIKASIVCQEVYVCRELIKDLVHLEFQPQLVLENELELHEVVIICACSASVCTFELL